MKQSTLDKRLFKAAQNSDLQEVEALLLKGANPDAPITMYKETALDQAGWQGNLAACRLMLDHGASLDVRTMYGQTPLHKAAHTGKIEVCRLFIARGADVHASDNNERTPMHMAAERAYIDVCRLLIAHGADPMAADKYKKKPIHSAIGSNNLSAIRFFLDQCGEGEHVGGSQANGRTLEQYAKDVAKPEMAAYLVAYENSLKTEKAIQESFPVDADAEALAPSRSRGFPPL